MTGKEKNFIMDHRIAHLSTVDTDGNPHVVPIVYVLDNEVIYTPVDSKPKRNIGTKIQRVKNIENNSSVSVVIDDYSENWDKLAWVQIRGDAHLINQGYEFQKAVDLIKKKYPQYGIMNFSIYHLIAIISSKVLSWQV